MWLQIREREKIDCEIADFGHSGVNDFAVMKNAH
jgi:hypothetical protein